RRRPAPDVVGRMRTALPFGQRLDRRFPCRRAHAGRVVDRNAEIVAELGDGHALGLVLVEARRPFAGEVDAVRRRPLHGVLGFDTQCMGFLVPVISENLRIALPSFGPVLSAALVGLMIAAMATGPIADRWGRRWVVIASVTVFALFALLTARANTLQELVLFR